MDQIGSNHRIVGETRGLGLLIGVEIQDGKAASNLLAHKVVYASWQRGLLLYYLGMYGNVLIIVPPLMIDEYLVDAGLSILEDAINAVEQGKISDQEIKAFAAW
jgi:4-aminobutyrate aminotransferase